MPACVADYCLDWNNDCCAPTQFDEPVACADGYTPQLTGEGCYDFEDGAFECCEPLPATSDEAAELLARLAKGAGETVLWGHQDDLASGATWSAVNGGDGVFRSDVLDLSRIRYLVLDEADRLLDDSFGSEMECILGAVGHKRQTLLFSATMSQPLQRLQKLALNSPHVADLAPLERVPAALVLEVRLLPLLSLTPVPALIS